MAYWPNKPFIYEINTLVWLNELSQRYGERITLNNIPDAVVNELADLGIDGVWMMGAWQRSPAARRSALNYIHEYEPALPGMTEEDVSGSPYAIYTYEIDKDMGGRQGMLRLRRQLAERGLRLMLDFVPNHMAVDSPWIHQYPGYFVQGTQGDYRRDNFTFFKTRDDWGRELVIARGRDPYFPAWIDTAQLNAFSPELRRQATETLLDIAEICDGVRCDMAMLMTNGVFERTWSWHVRDMPKTEYWEEIIPVVQDHYPDFLFIAEVYWDMEYHLLQQGFDFTYDKRLYDRVVDQDALSIQDHLIAHPDYQRQMVRFLENHDEPRAADTLGIERQPASAVLTLTLPGASLLFHGQLSGSVVKLPVQLRRAPVEPFHEPLYDFYRALLQETRSLIYQDGQWSLLKTEAAWSEYPTHDQIIAHGWQHVEDFRLIVVNLADFHAQAAVRLDHWTDLADRRWHLYDALNGVHYDRWGSDLRRDGLFVELQPHGYHVFHFEQR